MTGIIFVTRALVTFLLRGILSSTMSKEVVPFENIWLYSIIENSVWQILPV